MYSLKIFMCIYTDCIFTLSKFKNTNKFYILLCIFQYSSCSRFNPNNGTKYKHR